MTFDQGEHDELLQELDATAGREQQLVDLIRLDYDSALRAISGFVGSGSQIRAVGIAAWGVVLGLAVRGESALLAGLALVLVALFAYADAYHAALYRRALSRAINLEGLLDAYLDRLGIEADDPEARARTRAKLETHRFGMYRTLKPLKPHDYFAARPRPIFAVIYPSLAAATVALLIYYAV